MVADWTRVVEAEVGELVGTWPLFEGGANDFLMDCVWVVREVRVAVCFWARAPRG